MIIYPKNMIELKENMSFTILASSRILPNRYKMTFKLKDKVDPNFDWYSGAVLGNIGHIVSVEDFPRIYAHKVFNTKAEAQEFIATLPEEIQFSKMVEINYDK